MSMMRVSLRSLITLLSIVGTLPAFAQSASCTKTAYLTFDTGNMAVAQYIAQVLQQNKIKATFFLANEKTKQGRLLHGRFLENVIGKSGLKKAIVLVATLMTIVTGSKMLVSLMSF